MAEEKKTDNTYYIIVAGALILMVGFMLAMNSWREDNEANVGGFAVDSNNPAAAFENIKDLNNRLE